MNVLIIGGAGNWGSELCRYFKEKHQATVVAFDDLSSGSSDRIKHGPLVKVDARETPRLAMSLNEYKVEHLVLCALSNDADVSARIRKNFELVMSCVNAAKQTTKPLLSVVGLAASETDSLKKVLSESALTQGLQARWIEAKDLSSLLAAVASPHHPT